MKVRMFFLMSATSIIVFACSSRMSSNKSGTTNLTEITSLNLEIGIKELLPEGKIPFEVLDSMEMTERQVELTYKALEAYQKNMDAFIVYLEKRQNNQDAKYPENEILSENEFLEYMDFLNKGVKLLPIRTEIVEVIYSDNNRISFKADGQLAEIFSLITYHGKTNTFDLANRYTLEFIDSVNVETTTNAFQETWKGYNWSFEDPKDMVEMPTMETLNKITFEQYKITLGRLSSGKTVMIITLRDFREGNWLMNVLVTIRMK